MVIYCHVGAKHCHYCPLKCKKKGLQSFRPSKLLQCRPPSPPPRGHERRCQGAPPVVRRGALLPAPRPLAVLPRTSPPHFSPTILPAPRPRRRRRNRISRPPAGIPGPGPPGVVALLPASPAPRALAAYAAPGPPPPRGRPPARRPGRCATPGHPAGARRPAPTSAAPRIRKMLTRPGAAAPRPAALARLQVGPVRTHRGCGRTRAWRTRAGGGAQWMLCVAKPPCGGWCRPQLSASGVSDVMSSDNALQVWRVAARPAHCRASASDREPVVPTNLPSRVTKSYLKKLPKVTPGRRGPGHHRPAFKEQTSKHNVQGAFVILSWSSCLLQLQGFAQHHDVCDGQALIPCNLSAMAKGCAVACRRSWGRSWKARA